MNLFEDWEKSEQKKALVTMVKSSKHSKNLEDERKINDARNCSSASQEFKGGLAANIKEGAG